MTNVTMTQAQLTAAFDIVQKLDRAHFALRDANDDDQGYPTDASRIADACFHLARLYGNLDALQKEVGTEFFNRYAEADAARYRASGQHWDTNADDRYNEQSA